MAGRGWRRRRLPVTLVLLTAVTSLLSGCATTEELYTPLNTFCPAGCGNLSAGSTYQVNRDGLLHSLSAGAATNAGFLNTTFGEPNDELFGVVMCFADTSWARCKKCLDRAPSYMMSTACPSGPTGALLYNECLLRYSDKYFVSMVTDDAGFFGMYAVVEEYVGDMVSMNNTRWKMMDRLIVEAAASPLRYALDNNETYTDMTTGAGLYGLVQCRRDLTTEECTRCPNGFVRILLDTFPNNTYAYFKGFNCFAKYQPELIALMMPPPDAPGSTQHKGPQGQDVSHVGLGVAAAASAITVLLTLAILFCLVFGCMRKGRFAIANATDEKDMEGKFRNGAGPYRKFYMYERPSSLSQRHRFS